MKSTQNHFHPGIQNSQNSVKFMENVPPGTLQTLCFPCPNRLWTQKGVKCHNFTIIHESVHKMQLAARKHKIAENELSGIVGRNTRKHSSGYRNIDGLGGHSAPKGIFEDRIAKSSKNHPLWVQMHILRPKHAFWRRERTFREKSPKVNSGRCVTENHHSRIRPRTGPTRVGSKTCDVHRSSSLQREY